MRRGPDDHSSHPYEVIRLHRQGEVKKAVCFYLVEGEPVTINIHDVLRATGLWEDPTPEEPRREYSFFVKVAAKSKSRPADLHENVLVVALEEKSES